MNNNLHDRQWRMYNNYKTNLNKDQEVRKPVGTAMAAAALQQHLSLSLGLPTIKPRGVKRVAPRPRKRDEEYVLDPRPPQPTLAHSSEAWSSSTTPGCTL